MDCFFLLLTLWQNTAFKWRYISSMLITSSDLHLLLTNQEKNFCSRVTNTVLASFSWRSERTVIYSIHPLLSGQFPLLIHTNVFHWTSEKLQPLQQRRWQVQHTSFTNQLLKNHAKSFENKTRLYHLCDNRWPLLSSPLTPVGLEQFGQYDVFWSLAHEENHRCKVSAWHLVWRTRSSHRTHHCSRW